MILEGKTAIITGGSMGIGRAIALELAEHGANIAIIDINVEKGLETVADVKKLKRDSVFVKTDISSEESVKEMVKQIKDHFGSIDILVNNAGVTRDKLLMRMSEEDWDLVMNINLKGAFFCTKAVSRIMGKQRSGKIVNLSSVVGVMGNAGQANYSASKAGLIGLTKSTAKELAGRNINVNAVAPGFIATDMTNNLPQEAKDFFLNIIPFNRPGTPEDIAKVVRFLASPDSDYISGQVLNIDGGMLM